MSDKAVAFISMLCCASLAACGDTTLFKPPERGGSDAPAPAVADSVVTLVATLPYSTLVHIAEQKLPHSIAISGNGHIACLGVPFVNPGHVGSHQECRTIFGQRVCVNVPDFTGPSIGTHQECADYHWNADINKDGPFQVSKSGKNIRISQDIHVTGKAGVGGTLAEILSLRGKNIDIHATPKVELTASLGKDWCPVVSVMPIGSWVDSASVEVVGRNCAGFDLGPLGHPELCAGPVNVTISDELNREFDKHSGELQRTAQSTIPCDSIKPKIIAQWHPYAIKISHEKLPALYLNIEPKSAAFSGLIPEDDKVRVSVRVAANTVLATRPVEAQLLQLPPLEPLNADRGSLKINLQATAPYEVLKQQLSLALSGHLFQTDVPGGKVEVRILDVDAYPSKDSLALGLKIDAKLPGRWFNTSGWVYLSGKPVPAKSSKAFTIENIGFATVVDNAFWKVAQSLFEGEILQALNAHATFDLTKEIDKASGQITDAIAHADIPGLKITPGTPDLTLDGVSVTADNLVVVAKLAMRLDAEVTEAILK
jgi:hypothetical protein